MKEWVAGGYVTPQYEIQNILRSKLKIFKLSSFIIPLVAFRLRSLNKVCSCFLSLFSRALRRRAAADLPLPAPGQRPERATAGAGHRHQLALDGGGLRHQA